MEEGELLDGWAWTHGTGCRSNRRESPRHPEKEESQDSWALHLPNVGSLAISSRMRFEILLAPEAVEDPGTPLPVSRDRSGASGQRGAASGDAARGSADRLSAVGSLFASGGRESSRPGPKPKHPPGRDRRNQGGHPPREKRPDAPPRSPGFQGSQILIPTRPAFQPDQTSSPSATRPSGRRVELRSDA
jgi:hypothetical protein